MKTFKEYIKENDDNHYSLLQNKVFAFKLPLIAFGKDEAAIVVGGEDDDPTRYIKSDICITHNNRHFYFILSGCPKVIIKITDSSKLIYKNIDQNKWDDAINYIPAYDIVDIEIKDPIFIGHVPPVGDIVDGNDRQADMLRKYIQGHGIHYVIENILNGFKLIKDGWLNEKITPANPETDAYINLAYPILKLMNNNIEHYIKPKFDNVRVNHVGDLP